MDIEEKKLQEEITKIDKILNRPWNKRKRKKIIKQWQKEIIEKKKEILEKSKEQKEIATNIILSFNAIYVLEDEEGKEWTKERLLEQEHMKLVKLIEFYIGELEMEVGEIE